MYVVWFACWKCEDELLIRRFILYLGDIDDDNVDGVAAAAAKKKWNAFFDSIQLLFLLFVTFSFSDDGNGNGNHTYCPIVANRSETTIRI